MPQSRYRPLLAAVLTAALAACGESPVDTGPLPLDVAPSFAKGDHGGGPPSGGETATNNLSVPTVRIQSSSFACDPSLGAPGGMPSTGFELAGSYYVQGVHTWHAQCITVGPNEASATAAWGDNLSRDARLKVGSPIRVELGLETGEFGPMDGFTVVKLEPSKLDREAAYGTLATSDDGGATYHATVTSFANVRVFDPGVTFSVRNVETGVYAVPPGSDPTAEVNATGKIIYGYNLRVTAAGEYEITFVIPHVDITGVNNGSYVTDPYGDDTVSLTIDVMGGGGGGGGGGGKGGGGGGGGPR